MVFFSRLFSLTCIKHDTLSLTDGSHQLLLHFAGKEYEGFVKTLDSYIVTVIRGPVRLSGYGIEDRLTTSESMGRAGELLDNFNFLFDDLVRKSYRRSSLF